MPKQGEEAEKKVKEFLEKKFGKPFSKQKIAIGKGKMKEFDLVSNDGKIVAEVKDFKFDNETTGKSGYASTRKHRLISACAYLAKVQAERKILALTNQDIYRQFKKDMEMEELYPTIEVVYVPMTQDPNKSSAKPLNKKEDTIVEKTHKDSDEKFAKINRIKRWANHPSQYNHKIIRAFLEFGKNGKVRLDDLKSICSNKDLKYYVKKFDGHYASMKTDAGNSHGKVFYDENGIVSIWPKVREEIKEHFESNG